MYVCMYVYVRMCVYIYIYTYITYILRILEPPHVNKSYTLLVKINNRGNHYTLLNTCMYQQYA